MIPSSSRASGAPLRDWSLAEYSRLSELLDESIEMEPAARNSWLDDLARTDPKSAAVLRDLFASQDAPQAQGFLDTRDLLTRHLTSTVDADPGLTGKQFGPYRVLSLLGRGGMASVWLADRTDGLFKRQVALKLIHPVLAGRVMTERLTREREILASLNHPHIARLFDAGIAEDGQPYLALEYVVGTPLTTYCDNRRLSIRERVELFQQVLSAVQYAHAHLVIHRDLKPSNILVTEEGQVQLLDFGIAKLLTEGEAKATQLTQLGGRALTPDYAAPEQIAGAPITTAADVYALGVMLYELLTGERPYRLKRDSRGALEEAILQADPLLPSRAGSSATAAQARSTTAKKLTRLLRRDLDAIAIKALKKSPTERYATANAFGEDVTRFLRGDVVLAQHDSLAYRALKFARRHRVAIAAASVLILTLGGGLAATSFEAKVASEQRDVALQAQLRLLTQTAAVRSKSANVPGALSLILEVLPHRGVTRGYTSEALDVFQAVRAADAQIFAITGHTDRVRSVAFSPDGRRILTASSDRTARIWDAATGREILRLSGHTGDLTSAAFSPDGRRVVTASFDKTARIWDAATGRELLQLSGHTDLLRAAQFSPDSQRIVTASTDKTARIWDAATGREMVLLSGHTDLLTSAAFSPDGRRVVTSSWDRTARIWDAATGREVLRLNGHTDVVTSAVFSPEGRRILTASTDDTARIWDAATGREILRLSGPIDLLRAAAFSPDGQRIVTASGDKSARIWDAATGREIRLLSGHTDWVTSAAFSPDGRRVVTSSWDRTARVWYATTAPERLLLNGHADGLHSAAFSPDGRRLVTASDDKTARIEDAATGREILRLSGHTASVISAAFSPDGRRLVTASDDKTAQIWDAVSGREILRLSGHTDRVTSAAFSPEGRRILTASYDRTTRIWDATTGRENLRLNGQTDLVSSAAFSPDGQRIVTASFDKTARVWDAATGRELVLLSGHTDWVTSAAFSPDGRRIATASADKSARIWDAATGRELVLLSGHTDLVTSAAFSPDGQRIVTASFDKTARIWDAATGRELVLLSGHTDKVVSAAFSPDGRDVLTASVDKTARVWNARVPALDVQIGWAEAAQFDPLSSTERSQLGLPAPTDVRRWPVDRSRCDESAAAPYDPDRRAAGVMPDHMITEIALKACASENRSPDSRAQALYQHGRALMANGNFAAARRELEAAVARDYRSAQVDLGMLLSQPSAGALDLPRAIALYQKAWNNGVTVAAFELGNLYEHGVTVGGNGTEYLLAPDQARAWFWYQRAAEAADPNALARFAEREDAAAFSENETTKKNSSLLSAFRDYAAAAERARIEDWPDEASRNWRYHRASLARLLARQGMMQEVADTYDGVRQRYAPRPTLWKRVAAALGSMD